MDNTIFENKKCLIIDDSLSDQRRAELVLNKLGAITYLENSAETALLNLEFVNPDIIFCDIAMGDKDGYQFVTKIRTLGDKSTPVIMVSSHTEDYMRSYCDVVGANGFIEKPATRQAMLSAAQSVLSQTGSISKPNEN